MGQGDSLPLSHGEAQLFITAVINIVIQLYCNKKEKKKNDSTVHHFNKYLLGTSLAPDTVLYAGDTPENQRSLPPGSLHSTCRRGGGGEGETDNKL